MIPLPTCDTSFIIIDLFDGIGSREVWWNTGIMFLSTNICAGKDEFTTKGSLQTTVYLHHFDGADVKIVRL